jgi:hypothetical protein
MIIFGAVAGLAAGGIMILLSHLAPRFGAGAFVKDVDVIRCFGRTCSRRESHVIGVTIHAILYSFFGLIYAFGASAGIVSGYGALPLCLYALIMTVFLGGVIMPLEGHGLFGLKEDHWFAADLLLANIGWVILYGLIMGMQF